ncbi:unnamed protein product [Tilletia laevis]|uniref:Uncharacterized protein n=2 Tax=Tilletia TaxID=13289 RepID=A0A9N8M8G2_9BASI|nr:hypothetical protein CF336_g536 [Tilletia laevis]KAE8208258.1 hypothetical protein CF335_g551 [Tilletia laevis]CAD6938921.1 unnamed protein product [Tilletia caries]CAD6957943.1 unnamed protein product [Tilletia laevis]CAD6962819.1 unnamed protein product [Tilletia laevis]
MAAYSGSPDGLRNVYLGPLPRAGVQRICIQYEVPKMPPLTAPTSLPPNSEVQLLAVFFLRQFNNKKRAIDAALEGANTLRAVLEDPFDELVSAVHDETAYQKICAFRASMERTNANLSYLVDMFEKASSQFDHLGDAYFDAVNAIDAYTSARTVEKAFPRLSMVDPKPRALSDARRRQLSKWAHDLRYEYDEGDISFMLAREKNEALQNLDERGSKSDTGAFHEGDLALPTDRAATNKGHSTVKGKATAGKRLSDGHDNATLEKEPLGAGRTDGAKSSRNAAIETTIRPPASERERRAAKIKSTGTATNDRAKRTYSDDELASASGADHQPQRRDLRQRSSDMDKGTPFKSFRRQSVESMHTSTAGKLSEAQCDRDIKLERSGSDAGAADLTGDQIKTLLADLYVFELHAVDDAEEATTSSKAPSRAGSSDYKGTKRRTHDVKHEPKDTVWPKDRETARDGARRPRSGLSDNPSSLQITGESAQREKSHTVSESTPVAVHRASHNTHALRDKENDPKLLVPLHRIKKERNRRRSDEHETWLHTFRASSSFAVDDGTSVSTSPQSFRTASMERSGASSRNDAGARCSDEYEALVHSVRTSCTIQNEPSSKVEVGSQDTTSRRARPLDYRGQENVDGRMTRRASRQSSLASTSSTDAGMHTSKEPNSSKKRRGTAKRDTLGNFHRILVYSGSSASNLSHLHSAVSDSDENALTPRPKAVGRARLPTSSGR